MSISVVRRERKAVDKVEVTRSGAATPSGISKSEEGKACEEKLHALEWIFGTTTSVLCGEYDIPGLDFPRGIILDIGANVGAFAVWALYRWPECRVISYEPCAATYKQLSEALASQTRCETINAAVTEADKPFLRYGVNSNQENSIKDLGCQRKEGEHVKTIKPFDLPFADFVKIDTEGCELEILRSYLNKHMPLGIALEWHSREDRLALGQLLRGKGYKVTESPNVPVCINKGVYVGVMKGVLR